MSAISLTILLVVTAGAVESQPAPHSAAQAHHSDTSSQTRQSAVKDAPSPGTSCVFDFERGEIPDCVHQSPNGELVLAPQVLKQLSFDSHGLAPVLSPKEGWMYVSRSGKVVVAGVPSMDNWADSFHDGLVRVVRSGKYGFANRQGQVVIPAIYDGAMNFEKGRALVCNGCESKAAAPGSEHHFFAGGEWFRIDTKGTVLGRAQPEH
jgi:hypothetical protein